MDDKTIDFLGVLHSHIIELRRQGRTPTTLLLNDVNAGQLGITEEIETAFGLSIRLGSDKPWVGFAILKLDDTSEYKFEIPVDLTELW